MHLAALELGAEGMAQFVDEFQRRIQYEHQQQVVRDGNPHRLQAELQRVGGAEEQRAEHDPWFRAEDMPEIVMKFCSEFDVKNPLVSPVYADASDLPPMLIQVGDHEILLSDSTRLADNIAKAGGEVTLQVWPDMWHVFQFFIGQMPESRKAIKGIAEYLRQQFGAQAVAQKPQEDRAA